MSAGSSRGMLIGRRETANTALSDFTDYVERQQQALRNKLTAAGPSGGGGQALRNKPTAAGPSGGGGQAAPLDPEDELSIIDQLGLGDDDGGASNIKLKDLLFPATPDEDASSRETLKGIIQAQINEGRGETLFDVGLERNGDGMGLGKEEYEAALERLEEVAKGMGSAATVLLEKGGVAEGEGKGAANASEGWHGKVLIRRQPKVIEELLEIRVAVVGNGEFERGRSVSLSLFIRVLICGGGGCISRCGEVNVTGCFDKGHTRRW